MQLVVILLFFGLGLTSIGLQSAFAAELIECKSCVQILQKDLDYYKSKFPLVIWTDHAIYNHNSVITVNGYLNPQNNVAPVLVKVTNPIGNLVTINQLEVSNDGNFSFDLNPTGPLWKSDGNYIIHATSGVETRSFKTQISLVSHDIGTKSTCSINEITINANNGGVYCMSYKVGKGEITGIDGTLNIDTKTLSLSVRGNDIESLILNIPRDVVDSRTTTGDSDFILMSNGVMMPYAELESNSEIRQIQLQSIPDHRATFTITGTHVVPEFGMVIFVVLIAAMSVMLIFGKTMNFQFYRSTV